LLFLCTQTNPLRIAPVYCFEACAFALQFTPAFLVDLPCLNRSSAFKDSPLQLAPTRREPIHGGSAAAVLAADGLGNLQQTASCPEQCWYLNL